MTIKKPTRSAKQTSLKKSTLIAFLVVLAATILIVVGVAILTKPRHTLGNEMEYIGKFESGCWLPLCGSRPNTDYFYGTNIGMHDIQRYFSKASFDQTDNYMEGMMSGDYNFQDVYFNQHSNYFIITYFDDKNAVIKDFKLNNTTKKYVVRVNSEVYKAAKDSLTQL